MPLLQRKKKAKKNPGREFTLLSPFTMMCRMWQNVTVLNSFPIIIQLQISNFQIIIYLYINFEIKPPNFRSFFLSSYTWSFVCQMLHFLLSFHTFEFMFTFRIVIEKWKNCRYFFRTLVWWFLKSNWTIMRN